MMHITDRFLKNVEENQNVEFLISK